MAESAEDLYERAQKDLVSSLLYDGSESKRILEIVDYTDFADPIMETIFYAITLLTRGDEKVTPSTVASELERLGNLEEVGGLQYLYLLHEEGSESSISNTAQRMAAVVKELSAKKRTADEIEKIKESLDYDSGMTASEAISTLQSTLNTELVKLSDASTISDIATYIEDYDEILEERKKKAKENEENSTGLQGIPSLLPTLDKYTYGWMPGQLITVAARTGVGKSVFAIMSAVAAASAGKSVLFFSLEMGKASIVDRIVACMSGVSMNKLRNGDLDDEEKESLDDAIERLKTMKIKIDTDEKITSDSIRARCDKQAQTEDGLDMVIIDYLQLITPVGRQSNRQEQVAEISRNMKLVAKSLDVPLMVLAQLKRATGSESEEEETLPRVDDIRESGSIAQDSDIVILLHREPSKDGSTPKTTVILGKNRDGEAQKFIGCRSNLHCSRLEEIKSKDSIEELDESDFDPLNVDEDDLDEFNSEFEIDFDESSDEI